MKTVNKLDCLYRRLAVKARDHHNDTIDITDEEYNRLYLTEYQPEPLPNSDIPIPGEEESNYDDSEYDYLTFEALENGAFNFKYNMQCQYNDNEEWVTVLANNSTEILQIGDIIKVKCIENNISNSNFINNTIKFNCSGSITKSFKSNITFEDTLIVSAENLILPPLNISRYSTMFRNCTSLTVAPELSATTLTESCYQEMFSGCSNLTVAPELPATTLAQYCYRNMFTRCSSLTTAPELPATTLASGCYNRMFSSCTSLTTAPKLPATTLAESCYSFMFQGCTSLTVAPELPAMTLAYYCYHRMFRNCTSLITAPKLPATTLAANCYDYMFEDCTSLTVAPELPATILANNCYDYMFLDCFKLNYIKALFITIPGTSYTNGWVSGIASTGTFIKNCNAYWNLQNSPNVVPIGWIVQEIDPDTGEIVNEYINE